MSRGFISELTPVRVVINLDRELHDAVLSRGRNAMTAATARFRIDKDEISRGMGRIRDNLAQLFYVRGDLKRLSLIVDLKTPFFDESFAPPLESLSSHLNESQQQAVRKVMAAQDYALILGMPGTGKTTVISALIQMLVKAGKSILLASYTHSAVDTILLKLLETDVSVLRIGAHAKVSLSARTVIGELTNLVRSIRMFTGIPWTHYLLPRPFSNWSSNSWLPQSWQPHVYLLTSA